MHPPRLHEHALHRITKKKQFQCLYKGSIYAGMVGNALAAEGFRNLVLLGGGFNAWDQIFDKKLLVRNAAARATRSEWQVDPVNWGQVSPLAALVSLELSFEAGFDFIWASWAQGTTGQKSQKALRKTQNSKSSVLRIHNLSDEEIS